MRPSRWSNRATPGNITPSVGSTDTAMRATTSGVSSTPRANPVPAMVAATSAVLLPMPLLRGMGLPTVIRAASSFRSRYSSVARRASTALGQPAVASTFGVSPFAPLLYRSTRTLE